MISAYLTLRWSDLPALDDRFIEMLFVHKGTIDSAMLNTITGYIVYALTVLIPDIKRKRLVRKLAIKKIAVINSKSIYILPLVCKNKTEWNKITRDSDIKCFDDKFLEVIKRFDITCKADTILGRAVQIITHHSNGMNI